MSGFDPDWLDLREAADHQALAKEPLERLAATFADRESVAVADLGAGSGSLLRALAPRLGPRQRWTLIDADEALLAHARNRLAGWADTATEEDVGLALSRGGKTIEVSTCVRDLSSDPLPVEAAGADLVTSCAFFDLAGRGWTKAFLARLAAAKRPLYAPLIYAGEKRFSPGHPLDDAAMAAFNSHQLREKGLGPAMGPGAAEAMAEMAGAAGFAVAPAASPWRLGATDAALTRRLARDMAAAIGELEVGPDLTDWLSFRIANADSAEVAHVDLLVEPR